MSLRVQSGDIEPELSFELCVLAGPEFHGGSDCNAKTNADTNIVDCHAQSDAKWGLRCSQAYFC